MAASMFDTEGEGVRLPTRATRSLSSRPSAQLRTGGRDPYRVISPSRKALVPGLRCLLNHLWLWVPARNPLGRDDGDFVGEQPLTGTIALASAAKWAAPC